MRKTIVSAAIAIGGTIASLTMDHYTSNLPEWIWICGIAASVACGAIVLFQNRIFRGVKTTTNGNSVERAFISYSDDINQNVTYHPLTALWRSKAYELKNESELEELFSRIKLNSDLKDPSAFFSDIPKDRRLESLKRARALGIDLEKHSGQIKFFEMVLKKISN